MLAGLLALILALLLPAELFASPAVPVTGFTPGRVYAAGLNKSGQLGDGTHADRKHLVFSNAAAILSVAAGGEHSLALDADGHLRSWGRNLYGQLGDGTIGPAKKPVEVVAASNFKAVAAGR
ncbi:MAG TPA: hypothetical protein VK548_27645, partial [Candidatus Acidoferrum sp.]|nr:hypothetical protein [Candidatus Acidoferrum sp.]